MTVATARTVLRRRVSLTGLLLEADGRPATGGSVEIVSGTLPPREAGVRADGRYVFFDLPPGDIAVSGRDRTGRATDTRPATLEPLAADAPPRPVEMDLSLRDAPAARPQGQTR